jgi:hypothetical protein
MTLSGPDVLRSIEEALRDIRREEDESVRRLARSLELSAKLKAQEGDLYRQLAAMRRDTASRLVLDADIGRVEAATSTMLTGHEQRLAAVETELTDLDARLADVATERARLKADIDRREGELGALAAKARPTLGTDPGYAQKVKAAGELAAIAEQAVRKTAEAEADRELKGRPFRDDPLFMYLWTRGYGTRSYKVNAFSAWLDGGVARFIGYAEARTTFSLINEIPLRLRDHAERQQERARAAAAEIAAIENVAVDSAGGRAAREAMDGLVASVAALDREVVALQDRRDEVLKSQRELAQGTDPTFATALNELTAVMGSAAMTSLLADARTTPKGQDVALIHQLEDLRQRGDDQADEAREQKGRLKTLAARRRDLEDIQYELKAQGFDSPRSGFADEALTTDILNSLLRGTLSASAYWDRVRSAHSWSGPPHLLANARPAGGLSRPRGAAPARSENLITAA